MDSEEAGLQDFHVEVLITPKKGVLDAQGQAVKNCLHTLGFTDVTDMRIGKFALLTVPAHSYDEAREKTDKMCKKLLVNPNMEQYELRIKASAREPS